MEQTPTLLVDTEKMSFAQRFFYGTGCAFELTKWIIIILVIGILIHFYLGTPFIVDGQSMEPNFHSGQFIVVDRWHYNFGQVKRGDVVVLRFPGDPEHKKYIKRVIGLPGDKVEIWNGVVYINGQALKESYIPGDVQTFPNLTRKLREDDYFLLGDNRMNSSDSRVWGISPRRDLIGRAWVVLYPFDGAGFVQQPKY